MKVALNAQLLSWDESYKSGGIRRVIYHLLRELQRDSRGHRYAVMTPSEPPADDPLSRPGLAFHPTGQWTSRPSARIAWEQTLQPLRLAALQPDLLHSLAYASPFAWRGPSVLTVYDLSFLRYPETFNRSNRLYLSTLTRLSARRARRVITISESAKSDIVRLLGVPAENIDITYPAADDRYRPLPSEEIARFRAEHELPDELIFYLGTLEPRKNLIGLLEAYAKLGSGRPPLYVAGGAGWRFNPIFERVKELGLESDVRFLGYVPEGELPHWYNAARLFVYPSLFEGFGLPVVEAMACGTPVITSNVSSLPEAAGSAAITLPPGDASALAAEMERILQSASARDEMRLAGFEQAKRFNWADMADRTVQSYERALSSPSAGR